MTLHPPASDADDQLSALFSPPAWRWFETHLGAPTPPQAGGWPAIARGENTLILAPTGSGKTLAAFLWGIDEIYRELAEEGDEPRAGVRLLYVSPLKALNNDIERNLRAPLAGIRAEAERMGQPLPPLRVAVRTGDTPSHARTAMVKQPPHILITTPESLYLILGSPRGRDMLRTVRSIIVDEIHTVVGEKRGVHLALSVERLEHLAGRPVQRIGLSATIRPLEEAARFLGGQDDSGQPRLVTVVDTGYKKALDLQVVMPVEDFRNLPGGSIWPSVIPQVLGDVLRHRTTLIFANNRRLAERTADRLNAQIQAERSEEIPPGSTEALAPDGVMRDKGIFAIGAEGPIKAHHGSTSREARREMEEALKAGRLPALVSTGTLELGIDIGAVDLVVQLQAPRSVAQGLQRVGRSGHLVGQTSKGRIYATHREDLVEAAAVVRGMLDGAVEPTRTPANALDVLAQQIIAAVGVDEWDSAALYRLVRRAWPYHDLSLSAWESVLFMVSGRFQAFGGPGHGSLRARIAWDRAEDRLTALPGTRLLALSNAGTIPDTGAYDVYLADGKTRVGTLDEEFVFETRPGDVFMLGSNVWRVQAMDDDKVVVEGAAGHLPRMPFWKGDYPWRSYELGVRIGQLRRAVADAIRLRGDDREALVAWLQVEFGLDLNAARALLDYIGRQVEALGAIGADDTIVVETFFDAVGEARAVIHSPFGGRVNGAWSLALVDALKERTGIAVESMVTDDGILLRFPGVMLGGEDAGVPATVGVSVAQATAPDLTAPAQIVAGMSAREARQRILRELPHSAVFGARFRVNAARALLLPRIRGRKRTPFWLQRLKARDLLATVLKIPEFPLVAETYRDCLRDVMDLGHLDQLLGGIAEGRVKVIPVHTRVPSPVAAELMRRFVNTYMYEGDTPQAEQQLQSLTMRRELVEDLLEGAGSGRLPLRPEAMRSVVSGAGRTGEMGRARTADELAVLLLELGDLTAAEVTARSAADPQAWLAGLAARGTVVQLRLSTPRGPEPRLVAAELAHEYRGLAAPGQPQSGTTSESSGQPRLSTTSEVSASQVSGVSVASHAADQAGWHGSAEGWHVLRRWLRWAGPVTRAAILDRYAFDPEWLDAALGELLAAREIVQGHFVAADGELEYCDRHLFEQVYRRTLNLLRREVQPVPLPAYQAFLLGWQGVAAATPREAAQVVRQLRGLALPALAWEREVLPARAGRHGWRDLDDAVRSGEVAWVAAGSDGGRPEVRFIARREGRLFLADPPAEYGANPAQGAESAQKVFAYLKSEGLSFFADLEDGLGLGATALRDALRSLALAGAVTAEDMDALAAVLREHGQPAEPQPRSALEEELAARRTQRPSGPGRGRTRPAYSRYRDVRRTVGAEAVAEQGWDSRWSAVSRAALMGPPLSVEARGLALAAILLGRYGVLTPEIVARFESRWTWAGEDAGPSPAAALWHGRDPAREPVAPQRVALGWGPLAEALARMELRGEVRRGYFIAGLSGVQYALPQAVEQLRAARDGLAGSDEIVVVSALDPANLYGGELRVSAAEGIETAEREEEGDRGGAAAEPTPQPSPEPATALRFARVPSTHVVLWRGAPVLVGEDSGSRLSAAEVGEEVLRRALQQYLGRPTAPRRVAIETWNGAPVAGSRGEALLRELGASRSPTGLDYWRAG